MTVLDASVLIAHLDTADAQHHRALRLLVAAAGSPLRASPITLAEALVAPARRGLLERARGALSDLGIEDVPLPEDAPVRLARLRAETGCTLPDCCALLAAEQVGDRVATFDQRLATAARRRGHHVLDGRGPDVDAARAATSDTQG